MKKRDSKHLEETARRIKEIEAKPIKHKSDIQALWILRSEIKRTTRALGITWFDRRSIK